MKVTYRTVVVLLPATPLGLLPERWAVEHWCNACRQQVSTGQLVAHAQSHEVIAGPSDDSFPRRRTRTE